MRRAFASVFILALVYACGGDDTHPSGETTAGLGGAPDDTTGGSSHAGRGGSTSGGAHSTAGTTLGGQAMAGAAEQPSAGSGNEPQGGVSAQGGMPGAVNAGAPNEAGAPTTPGEGGAAGAVSAGPVDNPLVLASTHFLDYGVLRVTFTLPVANLSVTLSPELPSNLKAVQYVRVDGVTVDVKLQNYHLPRDYQLSVTGTLTDTRPFTSQATLPGLDNGSRIAFISKQSGTGDIQHWAAAPVGAATPRAAADAICQGEAVAAGYHGTFVAFLSEQGQYDAGCRAFGLDGLLTNKCGQLAAPVDDAPWLSPTGLPIVDGASNVVLGAWQNAFSFYADGTRAQQVGVWTGTITGAKAQTGAPGPTSADCVGWTKDTNFAEVTEFVGEYLLKYNEFGSGCGTGHRLMCLQVGGEFFGPSNLHEVSGKRVFVSKGQLTGAMSFGGKTGRDAADALCQSEAGTANYANAASFHAYVGTSDDDAICHVLGATGKVGTKCGLGAFSSSDPWRRADDYPVATAAQLAQANLTAPIAFAADGSAQFEQRPWTGTNSNGNAITTCMNWSSGDFANTGASGLARALTNGFTFFTDSHCNASEPVYCFEQ